MSTSIIDPNKARIWRIIHRDNLPWTLANGLHCANSATRSPDWISIGNSELISKRARHPVPVPPGGVLNDYVPFYFTPWSVMMRNILTGRGGVTRRDKDELLILVSSLHHIAAQGLPFVFTDTHAYYHHAHYYSDTSSLDRIDWPLLQSRDFRRDADDPVRFERYQAEALVHWHCPMHAIQGIVCYTDTQKEFAEQLINTSGLKLPVTTRPGLYF
ncbi:MAG: DUF4433 domain-containing protein [Fluviicoccus sp.]|uniref:type II toxin-antitoxin system toxin DNA ADP-ribosyl transferase DarT n=1 Tax=Fluviicoccus sp. TaxID=2003552 RepID=UPI00271BB1B5|nr:DUF4433 domain-containing protein [Fluviicoccus sp.]MDO8332152.1 DUF4433 domain-containing protein [Fluviicoccus sp.]